MSEQAVGTGQRGGSTVWLGLGLVALAGVTLLLVFGRPASPPTPPAQPIARQGAPLMSPAAPPPSAPAASGQDATVAAAPGGSPTRTDGGRAALPGTLDPSKFDQATLMKAAPDAVSGDGYHAVSFSTLAAFPYDPYVVEDAPEGTAPPQQVPANIKELNGQNLAVQGYMVPIEIRKDQIKSFLLVRNRMLCCFGAAAGFNEWIFVRMGPDAPIVKFIPDIPLTVRGKFEVGEEMEDGMVMSLYRMEGQQVIAQGGF